MLRELVIAVKESTSVKYFPTSVGSLCDQSMF